MTSRAPAAPRNYFGIPHAPVDRSVAPVYHDTLDTTELLTGALELEIEALSPVHVGGGSFELAGDEIAKEPVRRGGRPVIPGTSIKGMCRQIFEAITASGSPFDRDEHRPTGRRAGPITLSAAASVFGTLGYQGRVGFDDAVPVGEVEPADIEPERIRLSVAYLPRKEVGRRFYGPLPSGLDQPATVPALAIPAGTVLRSRVRFRNLSRLGVGGIVTSLGVDRFTPRLGGGKYDDFGWVRCRITAYRLRPRGFGASARWEHEPDAVTAFVHDCQARVQLGASGREALDRLTSKLQFPGGASAKRTRP